MGECGQIESLTPGLLCKDSENNNFEKPILQSPGASIVQ